MSGCLLVGAMALSLAGGSFTLEWTHSIEKTAWREEWQVQNQTLRLTSAAVKGSGAGMEPGPDARLIDNWWVWTPTLPPVPELMLAASGKTGTGWQLCTQSDCREIGATASEPVILRPCPVD